jgi:uncharacterized membrane protein
MSSVNLLSVFSLLDLVAVAALLLGWTWIGWRIENPSPARPSVSRLMTDFRRDWMHQMVSRDPRVFDAQLIGNRVRAPRFSPRQR